jgi:serine phosphatase RsbU (regulator of sigma subunit)/Tfp pilus assembly protein PilF
MRIIKRQILVLLLFFPIFLNAQNSNLEDLKSALLTAKQDTAKINILLSLSQQLCNSSPTEAMQYSSEAKALAIQLKYNPGEAYALKYIGLINFYLGNYVQAYQNWEQALKIFEETDDKKSIANMLSNLGVVYSTEGNDAKALEYYLKALKLAEEINDTIRKITTFNNIGLIYSKKPASENLALENYLQALQLSEIMEYYDGIGSSSLNLGELYYKQENYSTALEYFEKSLSAYRNTNTVNITNALTYIGKIYVIRKDYDAAIRYQEESLKIAEKLGAQLEMAKASLGLAETFFKSGNNSKAIQYNKNALEIATKLGASNEKMSSLEGLAKSYAYESDFHNAYVYLSEAVIVSDTIFSEKNQEQLNILRVQYEIENMLHENDILKKDIEIREIENTKQLTVIFFLVLGFIVTSILIALLSRSNKQKRKANNILEEKNILISEQKKEIMDSIQYAKRIQNAMLTPQEDLSILLPEHFILFSPRDIVSGDFYWITRNEDRIVCIVADCTGHGVPGAFMSMLGIAYLNEITSKNPEINAGQLLDELRSHVIQSLHQKGLMGENQDGMDITAVIIDKKKNYLQYAGANNPLFQFRNDELIEHKPDKMPIGIHGKVMAPFTNHEIKIEKGDVLYTFSDGFADQFGGPLGKKFMIKKFKDKLLELHKKPMNMQKEELEETLENWMANTRQVDDILVMGIRL